MPQKYIRKTDRPYPKSRAACGAGKRLLAKAASAAWAAKLKLLKEEMEAAEIALGPKPVVVEIDLDNH